MVTYHTWTAEPLPPLTEEEKERAFEAVRRARELVEEDRRRGIQWTPAGEEISALREARENEIG